MRELSQDDGAVGHWALLQHPWSVTTFVRGESTSQTFLISDAASVLSAKTATPYFTEADAIVAPFPVTANGTTSGLLPTSSSFTGTHFRHGGALARPVGCPAASRRRQIRQDCARGSGRVGGISSALAVGLRSRQGLERKSAFLLCGAGFRAGSHSARRRRLADGARPQGLSPGMRHTSGLRAAGNLASLFYDVEHLSNRRIKSSR